MSGFSLLQSPPPAESFFMPPLKKSHPSRLPHTRFLFPQRMVSSAPLNENCQVIAQQKLHFQLHSLPFLSCIIFTIASYSLYTETILILILVDYQYLEDVVFSSKSLFKFPPANKKFPLKKIHCSPPILYSLLKTLNDSKVL